MAQQGIATVDFGAYPGGVQATVLVTGQASILTTMAVEAWVRPQDATPEHSVDEHTIESLKVVAGPITAAAGFPINVECLLGTAYGRFNLNWVYN